MAPVAVALRLAPQTARAAVMNAGPAQALRLVLRVLNLAGQCLHQAQLDLEVAANTSAEHDLPLPAFDEPVVAELRALAPHGNTELARDCAWPEPYKFHRFAAVQPQFQLAGNTLHISTPAPLKGLWLEAAGTQFDDNFIDLLPGTACAVTWHGAPPQDLCWAALDHPPRRAMPAPPEPSDHPRRP
jgi:beta-mannosidase